MVTYPHSPRHGVHHATLVWIPWKHLPHNITQSCRVIKVLDQIVLDEVNREGGMNAFQDPVVDGKESAPISARPTLPSQICDIPYHPYLPQFPRMSNFG